MKVAFLAEYPNGSIDQVMQTLARACRWQGVEAKVFNINEGIPDLTDFDITHSGFYAYWERFTKLPDFHTANVWHISFSGGESNEAKFLIGDHNINHLVVDDVMTLQQLGLLGFTDVTKIPLPVDPLRWHHLPPPSGAFTVGVFCNNYPHKRYEVVMAAARQAGIKCHAIITDSTRTTYDVNPLNDVYAKVHTLVNASFADTNSLPLREALLCGRPVISIQNDGMGRVLRDKVNGLWFNGSIDDLAAKMLECRDNYTTLAEGAKATTLEPVADIAAAYIKMWKEVLA